MLAGAVLLLAAAASIFYLSQRVSAPALSVRAFIPPPPGTTFRASGFDAGPVVVSPDGKTLAFSAVDEKGRTNLWLRPLNAPQATMLAGTEDAAAPFWSPDSQYLGFVADQKLKRISASGGEAQALTEDAASSPGDWGADGTILFHKPKPWPRFLECQHQGERFCRLRGLTRLMFPTTHRRSCQMANTSFTSPASRVVQKQSKSGCSVNLNRVGL